SSDVCSSDLVGARERRVHRQEHPRDRGDHRRGPGGERWRRYARRHARHGRHDVTNPSKGLCAKGPGHSPGPFSFQTWPNPRATRALFPAKLSPMTAHNVDGPKTQYRLEFSAHQQRRDVEVARISQAQHGLITLEQLEGRGLTVQAVPERMLAGRIHRIHQRVYSLTPGVMTQ